MATIHELPSKESRGIPPELANLTREGLQEYMLGTIRESVFNGFEHSPEVAAVTLRREIAGRYWDITLERRAYATTDDPEMVERVRHDEQIGDRTSSLLYWWEASATDAETYFNNPDYTASEPFGTPDEAYADAREQIRESYSRDSATRAATERWSTGPAEGERAAGGG